MAMDTLCIFGTRPEAIKMAPLIKKLESYPHIRNKVCVTGQHRQMLHAVLELFEITPDFDLDVMSENQDLSSLTSKILLGLANIFKGFKPQLVIVHGDTTTTFAASLCAYYHRIPVAHVEAGLRTGNIMSPWPEEANRKLTGALAAIHFAPTELSRLNLLKEGNPPSVVFKTGNTVIDALQNMVKKIERDASLNQHLHEQFSFLRTDRKMILVTGHRRENFGEGINNICLALLAIARQWPELDIVYPVHLNPNVQTPVKKLLGGLANVYLIEPVDYLPFVYLLKSAYLVITDSGGIQEEAPALGKPVLVTRETTERPEAVEAGTVKLVGTDTNKIINCIESLLTDDHFYKKMSRAQNPYGDGWAAQRIAQIISKIDIKNGAVLVENTSSQIGTPRMDEVTVC